MAGEQHDPEYVKLNPKHVVPTLVHDGRVFVESSLMRGKGRITITGRLGDVMKESALAALTWIRSSAASPAGP